MQAGFLYRIHCQFCPQWSETFCKRVSCFNVLPKLFIKLLLIALVICVSSRVFAVKNKKSGSKIGVPAQLLYLLNIMITTMTIITARIASIILSTL